MDQAPITPSTNKKPASQTPKWKWLVVIGIFFVPIIVTVLYEEVIWVGDIPNWITPLSVLAIPAWIVINRISDVRAGGFRRRNAIVIISFIVLVAVAYVAAVIARDTDMPNNNIYP